MDVLLAPVYQSFLETLDDYLGHGKGFVVGPVGTTTATDLFMQCAERGKRDPSGAARFSFRPLLPGIVYESHVAVGTGGYRYVGLIDEIEINETGDRYRYESMKPGRGDAGEKADDERLPAYVRFRVLVPVSELVVGLEKLDSRDVGQSDGPLRHFKFGELRRRDVCEAIDRDLRSRV